MASPSSYYRDPAAGAVDEMRYLETKKVVKAERNKHRAKVGCSGCWYAEEVIEGAYLCGKGVVLDQGQAWCRDWWDIRTGKAPI